MPTGAANGTGMDPLIDPVIVGFLWTHDVSLLNC